MAKSRWQQFANNFNSTYGAVTNVAKGIETSRVMGRDYEDEEGNPLQGEALRSRRYEGLADVYAKYDDAEGALGLMSKQEQLRAARMGNEITAATKDDVITNAGLTNDALRARIAASNRAGVSTGSGSGSGSGSGVGISAAEKRALDAQREAAKAAQRQAIVEQVFGSGGNQPPAPEGATPTPSDSSPNRTSPARPGGAGLTPPPPAGTPPQVGGSPSRQESRAAPGNVPDVPMFEVAGLSTRGLSPEQMRGQEEDAPVRTAQLDPGLQTTMNDAGPGAPPTEGNADPATEQQGGVQAQTRAPRQPQQPKAQPKAVDVIARGIKKNRGGQPSKADIRQSETAANDVGAEQLEQLTNVFIQVGDFEAASQVVQLGNDLGEAKAAKLVREQDQLRVNLENAARRGGAMAAVRVLDEDNGAAIDTTIERDEDGSLVVMDYIKDQNGDRAPYRILARGSNMQELTDELMIMAQPLENRLSLKQQQAELVTAQSEAILKSNETPGQTYKERLLNRIEQDPFNPVLLQAYALEYGLAPEDVEAAFEDWQNAEVMRRTRAAAEAGAGEPPAEGGGLGQPPQQETSEPPQARTQQQGTQQQGTQQQGVPPVGEEAQERARSIYGQIRRQVTSAQQQGPGVAANRVPMARAGPQEMVDMVYRAMKADPELGRATDDALRQLAEQTVVTSAGGLGGRP